MNHLQKRTLLKLITLSLMVALMTGCYGNFKLTKKLYSWNGQLGSPEVNSVVMFVLVIIPVYEVVGLVDFVFLNTIEHYTGSNPVTLEQDAVENQIVVMGDDKIRLETRKSMISFFKIEGDSEVYIGKLVYDAKSKSWAASNPSVTKEIDRVSDYDPNMLELIGPENEVVSFYRHTPQIVNE